MVVGLSMQREKWVGKEDRAKVQRKEIVKKKCYCFEDESLRRIEDNRASVTFLSVLGCGRKRR
jgi:hypothetical protein